ncbi:MAG: hypothetical protein QM731_28860 [Chitinophagaceae bacterium]
MKIQSLLIGLVIGAILGYCGAKFFTTATTTQTDVATTNHKDTTGWTWPDSLDAIKAAPLSHTILYEDDSVRILNVTVLPGQTEPIHAHRWRSVAWAVHSTPFTLFHYGLDNKNKLVKQDSFNAVLPINIANKWAPEFPHSIRNTGNDTLVLYRVELKQ